jgi:hypothetical protein
MAGIEAALEALESLESLKLGNDFKYSEIAAKYNCDRTTLSRRYRGVTEARATKLPNGRLLNTTQEFYLTNMARRGSPNQYDATGSPSI